MFRDLRPKALYASIGDNRHSEQVEPPMNPDP